MLLNSRFFTNLVVMIGLILAQGPVYSARATSTFTNVTASKSGRVTDESGFGVEGVSVYATPNSSAVYLPLLIKFRSGGGTRPGAFNKISPASGLTNQPASLILDWGDSSEAASYAYCYDTTNDNACSNWISTGASSQASISALTENTTYYWQVRAKNSVGNT